MFYDPSSLAYKPLCKFNTLFGAPFLFFDGMLFLVTKLKIVKVVLLLFLLGRSASLPDVGFLPDRVGVVIWMGEDKVSDCGGTIRSKGRHHVIKFCFLHSNMTSGKLCLNLCKSKVRVRWWQLKRNGAYRCNRKVFSISHHPRSPK